MDVRTLRYYVGVVQNGSISRASEHLHITQPALSHALKDLEQELGQSLFTRGARLAVLGCMPKGVAEPVHARGTGHYSDASGQVFVPTCHGYSVIGRTDEAGTVST